MTRSLRTLLVALLLALPGTTGAATGGVIVAPLTGAIGPATADFIGRTLARAADEHAQLVVLTIDTPGGLDGSMRKIIKDILASPVPVASFVAPGGARAASAGTYILYASHVAAMAPGTNLGAATPVNLAAPEAAPKSPTASDKDKTTKTGEAATDESTLARKQMQDAAAYIRSLAQLRGRNAQWAERAVREAASLSATEAVKDGVVDLMASDVEDLLVKLDGREVATASGKQVLATRGAAVVTVEPDWRTRFLSVITDPSVALLLLMAGVYLLVIEFTSPGMAVPGVLGAICLLTALFALQMLPIDYAGLALVLLGVTFMIAEAFFPSYGSLGIGGVAAFSIGAVMLVDTDVPGFGISPLLIGVLAIVSVLFMLVIAGIAFRARTRPVVTGDDGLIGSVGVTLDDVEAEGWARVHGEQWRVRSQVPLRHGQAVRVTARDGLVLTVEPAAGSPPTQ